MSIKITIANLKKHNADFFTPELTEFHQDKGYEIIDNPNDGGKVLKVTFKNRDCSFYKINPSTLQLTYYKIN